MNETSKAVARRRHDPAFHTRFFAGVGIDVGCGDDPLSRHASQFARMTSCRGWDKADGNAQTLPGVPAASLDFLHSSHCLEHLPEPVKALTNWLRVVKPGGHLIVTVPDFDLYEGGVWPSRWNADHKHAFSLHRPTATPVINLLTLLSALSPMATVERVQVVRDGWEPSLAGTDQTLGPAESCIEFVLRKLVSGV